jgi:hypothetical protein
MHLYPFNVGLEIDHTHTKERKKEGNIVAFRPIQFAHVILLAIAVSSYLKAEDVPLFSVDKPMTMTLFPASGSGDFLHGDLAVFKDPLGSDPLTMAGSPSNLWVGAKCTTYYDYATRQGFVGSNGGMLCGPDPFGFTTGSFLEQISGTGGEGVWSFTGFFQQSISPGTSWSWFSPFATITALQNITVNTNDNITVALAPGGHATQGNHPMVIKAAQSPTGFASTSSPIIAAGDTGFLSASGSHENNSGATTITSYLWHFQNTTTGAEFNVPSGIPTLSYPLADAGDYRITLTVTDSLGMTSMATSDSTVSVKAVKVTFNPASVTVAQGGTSTTSATIVPDDAADSVTFSTDDTSIATVSPTAVSSSPADLTVTGVSSGPANLVAKITSASTTATCGTAGITVAAPKILVSFDKMGVAMAPHESNTITATTTPAEVANQVTFFIADTSIATVTPKGGSTGNDLLTITGKKGGTTKLLAMAGGYTVAQADVLVLPIHYQGRPIFDNDAISAVKFAWLAAVVDNGSGATFSPETNWTSDDTGITINPQSGGFKDPDENKIITFNGVACTTGALPTVNGASRDYSVTLNYVIDYKQSTFSGIVLFTITADQIFFATDDINKGWYVTEQRNRSAHYNLNTDGVSNDDGAAWTTDSNYIQVVNVQGGDTTGNTRSSLITMKALASTPPNVRPIKFHVNVQGLDLDGSSIYRVSLNNRDPFKIEGPNLAGPNPNPVIAYPTEKKAFAVTANPSPKMGQLTLSPNTSPIQIDGIDGTTVNMSVTASMNDPSVSNKVISATLTYDPKIPKSPPATLPIKVELRPLTKIVLEGPANMNFLVVNQDPVKFKATTMADDGHVFSNAQITWQANGADATIDNGVLSVKRAGTVTVKALAKRTDNPTLQTATSVASDPIKVDVFNLTATLSLGNSVLSKSGGNFVTPGTAIKLSVKVEAGPNDVTNQTAIVWNTPSGTDTIVAGAVGDSFAVSAKGIFRGATANTSAFTIDVVDLNTQQNIMNQPNLLSCGWEAKRSLISFKVPDVPGSPTIVVGKVWFRKLGTTKEYSTFVFGGNFSSSFSLSTVNLLKIAKAIVNYIESTYGKKFTFTTLFDFVKPLDYLVSATKDIIPTGWAPVYNIDGIPIKDVTSFYGPWQVLADQGVRIGKIDVWMQFPLISNVIDWPKAGSLLPIPFDIVKDKVGVIFVEKDVPDIIAELLKDALP